MCQIAPLAGRWGLEAIALSHHELRTDRWVQVVILFELNLSVQASFSFENGQADLAGVLVHSP